MRKIERQTHIPLNAPIPDGTPAFHETLPEAPISQPQSQESDVHTTQATSSTHIELQFQWDLFYRSPQKRLEEEEVESLVALAM